MLALLTLFNEIIVGIEKNMYLFQTKRSFFFYSTLNSKPRPT